MKKKTRVSLALSVTALLGLGAVVLSETNANASCGYTPQNVPYSFINMSQTNYQCTTPQAKWCHRVTVNGFTYTEVMYRNWTKYSEAAGAANAWNNGTTAYGGNSLGLIASGASSNDIDIVGAYYGGGWWGMASMGGGATSWGPGGCFYNNAGLIQVNYSNLDGNSAWRNHTFRHEIGHEVGLGHVSGTRNMNPNGSVSSLTNDDELGVEKLYP